MTEDLSSAAIHLLIPSAGVGSRAGGELPKQYQLVAGRPLLEHTLAAFQNIREIKFRLLSISLDDTAIVNVATGDMRIARNGGDTRAQTVRNGLAWLLAHGAAAQDWVLVHDAARCCIAPAAIERLIAACVQAGEGGLLAVPLSDTLKLAKGKRARETLPRENKWLAQTPQMFRIGELIAALDSAAAVNFTVTDEASAIERTGRAPLIVRGDARNLKVTYPEDFALAEALLGMKAAA
jgi:2-C-methyl-D-erythritol 4-phosphate cytidylyltransferase